MKPEVLASLHGYVVGELIADVHIGDSNQYAIGVASSGEFA